MTWDDLLVRIGRIVLLVVALSSAASCAKEAVDEQVVFAPSIQQASFERDEITIAGDFDRAELQALAAALEG